MTADMLHTALLGLILGLNITMFAILLKIRRDQ